MSSLFLNQRKKVVLHFSLIILIVFYILMKDHIHLTPADLPKCLLLCEWMLLINFSPLDHSLSFIIVCFFVVFYPMERQRTKTHKEWIVWFVLDVWILFVQINACFLKKFDFQTTLEKFKGFMFTISLCQTHVHLPVFSFSMKSEAFF